MIKKFKRAWDKHFHHIFTILTLLNMLIKPNLQTFAIWFIYMGYFTFRLLDEFVRNHRTIVIMQCKDYIDRRALVPDQNGEEEE